MVAAWRFIKRQALGSASRTRHLAVLLFASIRCRGAKALRVLATTCALFVVPSILYVIQIQGLEAFRNLGSKDPI